MKTELLIVRHGETDGNRHGLLHGSTDLPMTGNGFHQAQLVAQRIATLGAPGRLYSSPLNRALATAEAIAARTGAHVITDDRLSEFDFGELEGIGYDDLHQSYPELYLSMINPESLDHRFPAGESRSTFQKRVVEVSEHLLSTHRGERLVVVAHLIVIAALVAHLTTGDSDDIVRYLVRNGSLTHLVIDQSGSVEVLALDDVSHLT